MQHKRQKPNTNNNTKNKNLEVVELLLRVDIAQHHADVGHHRVVEAAPRERQLLHRAQRAAGDDGQQRRPHVPRGSGAQDGAGEQDGEDGLGRLDDVGKGHGDLAEGHARADVADGVEERDGQQREEEPRGQLGRRLQLGRPQHGHEQRARRWVFFVCVRVARRGRVKQGARDQGTNAAA